MAFPLSKNVPVSDFFWRPTQSTHRDNHSQHGGDDAKTRPGSESAMVLIALIG